LKENKIGNEVLHRTVRTHRLKVAIQTYNAINTDAAHDDENIEEALDDDSAIIGNRQSDARLLWSFSLVFI
jgi:hypothetical protein